MSDIENLWPDDLGKTDIRMPKTILSKQGKYLEEMAKNVIEVNIKSNKGVISDREDEPEVMVHEFIVTAPSAGNYEITLLRLMHDFNIYPVDIFFVLKEEKFKAHNEGELLETLKRIFSDSKTTNMLNSLLIEF